MKYANKRSLKSAAKKIKIGENKQEKNRNHQADKGKVTAILHTASLSSSFCLRALPSLASTGAD
jgi:hypothetical protein